MSKIVEMRKEATNEASENRVVKVEYNYRMHLDEVLKEIFAYQQKDGFKQFEEVSIYMKQKISKLASQYSIKTPIPKSVLEMSDYEKNIFKEIETSKQKQLTKYPNVMDDVLEKSTILEYGGITFGKPMWYKLKLAMKRLLLKEDAIFMKFWGRIYGRDADYLIIYGKLRSHPPAKYNKLNYHEPAGLEGINNYTFWVTNCLLEDWYQLPEISASQMKESFLIKYYFSGNLKNKVKSLTPFSGNESHLLKCQLLRVMHACWIVPDGYCKTKQIAESEELYGLDLNDKVTQCDEEFNLSSSNEELLSLDKWVHEFGYIYPGGRIVEPESGQDPVARLRAISQDAPFPGTEKLIWTTKEIGDKMQYNSVGDKGGSLSYSAVMIKNLRWPGFSCIAKNNDFCNIYIGDGSRIGNSLFSPTNLGEVSKDPDGLAEQSEPNFIKEPVVDIPKSGSQNGSMNMDVMDGADD